MLGGALTRRGTSADNNSARASHACRTRGVAHPAPGSWQPPVGEHGAHARVLSPLFFCLRLRCWSARMCARRGVAHAFGANEEPQPHEDSDCGLLRTWNEDEIISSTKSIVEPRTMSSEVSSITSFAPAFSNSTSSS